MKLSRLYFSIALFAVAITLTGCEGIDLSKRIEEAEELPLWQRIGGIALSTLISEDLACITAGMLASEGVISFGWALFAAFLGIYCGDVLLFALGRVGGIALLRRAPFRWFIKEAQIHQAENLFEEHGAKLIFSSRVLPGSRLPIYAAAGVLNYPFWRFSLFMALAGGLSAIILVSLSRHLGSVILDWLEIYESYAIPVFVAVILVTWISLKAVEILATKRSRLTFLVRTRRFWNQCTAIFRKS